jgi:hypothetical protein
MMRTVPDREVVREVHAENVATAFPWAIFGSWYFAMPLEHIGGAICIFDGFSYKSEGVIAPPVFPFLFKSVDNELVDLFFLHDL